MKYRNISSQPIAVDQAKQNGVRSLVIQPEEEFVTSPKYAAELLQQGHIEQVKAEPKSAATKGNPD